MKAVEAAHIDVVDVLLQYGADLNLQNQVSMQCFCHWRVVTVCVSSVRNDCSDVCC
jgi:hypothetical protein